MVAAQGACCWPDHLLLTSASLLGTVSVFKMPPQLTPPMAVRNQPRTVWGLARTSAIGNYKRHRKSYVFDDP
ncbi:hypothetical protein PF005_g7776 [Phytophthora fragariae]|uniref:Secreted protein n=1 Tax=Phytophthora fragariae TaxID=53985 RepID=A0A6A3SPD0_9STRA|nr:hypothetical protein PF009_g8578 [Phytophthora fragariae]KAE9120770.1 hypothetical protein PF007_g8043 [Phytophthora fragariae]KAE9219687.1 hypothetical protein PF005_g7776 [Phytophthora fragariae]